MTILLVQIFLLMLGAFLLGASLACVIRRGLSDEPKVSVPASVASAAQPAVASPAGTDRFGRALSGGDGPSVPPVFHPGQPVVEVQPRPEPQPEPAAQPVPVARMPQPPAPAPAPVRVATPEPQPAQDPVLAPPQRDVLPPKAAPAVEEPAAPPRSDSQSYTQVAVAAAAAAAAAAAKARADAEAAEKAEAEKAAAEAALAAPSPVSEAEVETRFGTPAARSPLEYTDSEPVDDLTRIHGIDVDLKERLVRYGIHRFSQVAAWTPDDVRGVSQTLGFQGRIESENWIEQARILAEGGDPSRARAPKPPAAVDLSPVDGDRLHRIIGVDPQSEELLRANGVTQLAQIAGWSAADIAHFEALLGTGGRIDKEGWVSQALFLTGGAPPAPEPEPVKPGPTAIVVEMPEPAAPAPTPAPQPGGDYSGLRSVRSEALVGDVARFVASGEIQDLKRIRGIGVLIEKKLNSLGITSYEQVANWTRADIDKISEVLDFKGRIERENWIEQARILASGGQTEFSRRVDRGDA